MIVARSSEAAALLEERLFEPDILRSKPGEPPSGARERLENWVWDKLTFLSHAALRGEVLLGGLRSVERPDDRGGQSCVGP